MIMTRAITLASEGLIAECEGLTLRYLPDEKKFEFNKPPVREYYKQWSVRWPTKKEREPWLKN